MAGVDKIVAELPLDHIVLETDGPYLSPVPHRGKRNLPGYILHIAQKLAEIKNITPEEAGEITSPPMQGNSSVYEKNSHHLYRWHYRHATRYNWRAEAF
jgi:hypothetical protein